MVDAVNLNVRDLPDQVESTDVETLLRIGEAIDAAAIQWLNSIGAEPRRLFVSYATDDYEPGLWVMIRTLRAVSDIPILVLKVGSWTLSHEADRIATITVPQIVKSNLQPAPWAPHYHLTITKLWVFTLLGVQRIVYLDADCLVLRSIDELFDGSGFAAAPDLMVHEQKEFNTGVFAVSPSRDLVRALFAFVPKARSRSGGEQSILNDFFTQWTPLPVGFNFLRPYGLVLGPILDSRVRVMHYVAGKPWLMRTHTMTDPHLHPLDDIWIRQVTDDEYRKLTKAWRQKVEDLEINRRVPPYRLTPFIEMQEYVRAEVLHAQSMIERQLVGTRRRIYLCVVGSSLLAAAVAVILAKLVL